MPGKRVQFDQETWNALDPLGRDRKEHFQELAGDTTGRDWPEARLREWLSTKYRTPGRNTYYDPHHSRHRCCEPDW